MNDKDKIIAKLKEESMFFKLVTLIPLGNKYLEPLKLWG